MSRRATGTMSGRAIVGPAAASGTVHRLLAELLHRQPALCLYGLALLALAVPLLAATQLDPRLLHGVGVWSKPTRFCISTGLFALTACWFFGYVRPEHRRSRHMRWTVRLLIASASFEIGWIGWQAGHGLDSHFNMSSPFYGTMFALMGLFALSLVCTSLPLAWEIAHRPIPGLAPELARAVVAGLVASTVLAAITGFTMAAHLGHDVGARGGRLPLFGWNRSGGDLRAAHFLGVHAEQAIPLLVLLLLRLRRPLKGRLAGAATALYVTAAAAVFVQALAGQPLLPR